MKGKDLFIYVLLIFVGIGTSASSCDDSDDDPVFPPLDVGDVTANRILISFNEAGDSTTLTTYEYYAPNGTPTVTDTIMLRKSSSGGFIRYESSMELLLDNDTMTAKVEARKERYIICYRDLNSDDLRVGNFNVDADGIAVGTTAQWSTVDGVNGTGAGNIRITMNYQPSGKEGLCNPGTRIIEAFLPFKLTN